MQFRATILSSGKTTTGIEVPETLVLELGAGKRPPVKVTMNGYTYRTTIAPMQGTYMISVSSEVRREAGVVAGDELNVTIELDTGKREIEVPDELAAALADDPEAKAAFDTLSNSRKQQLTIPITKAKAPETRARNVQKALAKLNGQ